MHYYHAQAAKAHLSRKWQWMATWPIIYRYGERVELVLEQPCLQYRIDIYIPSLRIAIEIDEAHHNRQAEDDARRQLEIETHLTCAFRRLRVEGGEGSMYAQLAVLFEDLDEQVLPLPPWEGPRMARKIGRVLRPDQVGTASEHKLQALTQAGIAEIVQGMLDDLAAVGVDTDTDNIKPLVKTNGELGFAVLLPGISFVVSVTASKTVKTLATQWTTGVPERLGLVLDGPNKGSVPYWTVQGMARRKLSIEETLGKFVEFNDILTNPGARFAADAEA